MSRKKSETFNWGVPRARRRGLKVIEPKTNELQIDLDGARALHVYGRQYDVLRRAGLTKGWREKVNPSRRSGHTHVTISMPRPMPLTERVGLQAILGDDLKRAAFNWCRVKRHNKYPVVFFERV